MYNIYIYRFGEDIPYHAILCVGKDRAKAIQTARDRKAKLGERTDYFEVCEGDQVVYHSIFGAYDDPRLP